MVVDNLELSPNRVKSRELFGFTEEIVDYYRNRNMTLREIGLKFNCDKGAIKRLLQKNGVIIHGSRTRCYTLKCVDCCGDFTAKSKASRCVTCYRARRNKQAKEYQRRFAKHVVREQTTCLKCGTLLIEARLGREYCDDCRHVRLNDLRRLRRAKNPEKYRQKDSVYNANSYAGHVAATNRRVRKYGKSILKVNLIRAVFQADNYTCQYCYRRGGNLTVDHITPLCHGGENDFTNLVTACRTCNLSKNNKSLLQFLLFINTRERN